MRLNDIRVAHKLWAIILVLLLAMVAVNIAISSHMRAVEEETAAKVEHQSHLIGVAMKWKVIVERNSAMVYATNFSTDPAASEQFGNMLKEYIAESGGVQRYLAENANTDEDKKVLEQIGKDRTAILGHTKRMAEAKAAGEPMGGILMEMLPLAKKYVGDMDAFVTLQEKKRDAVKAEAAKARDVASMVGLGSIIVVCLLGMAAAAALVRSINEPLSRAVKVAEGIAAGDLTQRITDDRRDEFGQLMNAMHRMNDSLANVVGNVLHATESIGTASAEIATGNLDLSARTEQTAANLEQTSASMEELTDSVKHNAEAAQQANQLTSAASEAATRGGRVVSDVVTTMEGITAASQKIADIIGVIDGIAFQTNILALNAAVEAARAGEQGRGFAVVASEVRSLAQRSASAAKEIKELITASTEQVNAGATLVQTAGATMQEIVASVGRVTDIMHEITAATKEQSTGINEVNTAVGNLDQMTQQNAALVEEAAAAATSLQEQARHLAATVSTFKVAGHMQQMATQVKAAATPAPKVEVASVPKVEAARPAQAISKAVVPPKLSAVKPRTEAVAAPAPAVPKCPLPSNSDDDWEEF